jgi:hypothetical protein
MEISFLAMTGESMPNVSKTKMMLIVFFDHKYGVHNEYAPQGQINEHFYLMVFRHICDPVHHE